jgi:hypothetical protein
VLDGVVPRDGRLQLAEALARLGDVRGDAVFGAGKLAALAREESPLDRLVPGEDAQDSDRTLRLQDLRRDVAQKLDGARRERVAS